MLDFVSRLNGQSITTVVERAIKKYADDVSLSPDNYQQELTWKDFWDPSEGIRTLRLLAVGSEWPTTFEEDELRQLTLDHWQFFYADRDGKQPLAWSVNVLWPLRDELLALRRETKATNYWAVAERMDAALSAAGLRPPHWRTAPDRKAKSDLDDDIPF